MNRSKLQADQLCKWFDTHALTTAQTDFCRLAPPPPTIAPPSAARSSLAGNREVVLGAMTGASGVSLCAFLNRCPFNGASVRLGVHRDGTDSPARHRVLQQSSVGHPGQRHVDRIRRPAPDLEPA